MNLSQEHVLSSARVDDLGGSADGAAWGAKFLNGLNDLVSLGDLAEDDVLAIEPAGLDSSDEELGAVTVENLLVDDSFLKEERLTCWDQRWPWREDRGARGESWSSRRRTSHRR